MIPFIHFKALLAHMGIFFWPLTAILAVALWNMASYTWDRWTGQSGDTLMLETINECGTLSQLVGMGGTIAGLIEGIAKMDPANATSISGLVAAMSLAFWCTYFGLITAIFSRMFLMYAPHLKKLSRIGKPRVAAKEVL